MHRSCAKLAYSEAQEALDKNTLPESVAIQNNESADSIKGDLRDLMVKQLPCVFSIPR